MVGPLLALALASGPGAILLPPWPLSPDGEPVAVRGEAPLEVEGGTAERLAPGLFRVLPAPGAREVLLSAGAARARASVEPPPGEIVIRADPPAPVKGRDAAVALLLEVRDAAGALDAAALPPVLSASSGQVKDLVPDGPGRFRAVWVPAAARHPEVAVLIALAPRCPRCPTPRAVGGAVLPVAAAIEVPGRSEPGARTTVTVAGRTFGPVLADRRGRFTVGLVVPPGARLGRATALDDVGNRTVRTLDLGLPAVDRLGCTAWPRALPADGRSEATVLCLAATDDGKADPGAALALEADAGVAGSLRPGPGGLRGARLRAPLGGGGKVVRLLAGDPAGSREELRVALLTGAPEAIELALARDPAPAGRETRGAAIVRDARGDEVGRASGPPGARLGFVSPERFVARPAGEGFRQEVPLAFALPPGGEAAALSLRLEGDRWVAEARTLDGRPAAGVPLRFGSGAEVVTDPAGEARAPAGAEKETVAAANGARAAGWAGIRPPVAPVAIARTVEVALRPPAPVDVLAVVEGRTLRWRIEDEEGALLPGRRVELHARGLAVGEAGEDAAGGHAALGPGTGTVSVVDAESGVTAVVEVR